MLCATWDNLTRMVGDKKLDNNTYCWIWNILSFLNLFLNKLQQSLIKPLHNYSSLMGYFPWMKIKQFGLISLPTQTSMQRLWITTSRIYKLCLFFLHVCYLLKISGLKSSIMLQMSRLKGLEQVWSLNISHWGAKLQI